MKQKQNRRISVASNKRISHTKRKKIDRIQRIFLEESGESERKRKITKQSVRAYNWWSTTRNCYTHTETHTCTSVKCWIGCSNSSSGSMETHTPLRTWSVTFGTRNLHTVECWLANEWVFVHSWNGTMAHVYIVNPTNTYFPGSTMPPMPNCIPFLSIDIEFNLFCNADDGAVWISTSKFT